MARNRLGEYQDLNALNQAQEANRGYTSVDLGPTGQNMTMLPLGGIVNINQFLQMVEEIQQTSVRVDNNVAEMRAVAKRLDNEVNADQADVLKLKLEHLTQDSKALLRDAKDGIQMLQKSRGGDPAIRQAKYEAVGRRVRISTQNLLSAESDIGAAQKARVTREFKIVRPDATDDEVRRAIESGSGYGSVFENAMLESRVTDQRGMLDQVRERKKALDKVLESIQELSQLVHQLDDMINTQQFIIDDIEVKTEMVAVDVRETNVYLTSAVDNAASARKKQYIIFGIIAAILIIIGIILAIKFGGHHN